MVKKVAFGWGAAAALREPVNANDAHGERVAVAEVAQIIHISNLLSLSPVTSSFTRAR